MRILTMSGRSIAVWAAVVFGPVSVTAAGPVVDGHNHMGFAVADGRVDASGCRELARRGIDAVVVPLPVDRTRPADLEERILREIAEIRAAASAGRLFSIAADPAHSSAESSSSGVEVFFSIEWRGAVFDGDLARAARYRNLGIRVIGLWEDDADGLFGRGGDAAILTNLGRRLVAAMNDAGVVIDVTHLSHAQMLAVIAASRRPVVASHSLLRAVTDEEFNLPEDIVAALAANRGSVWVSFNRVDLLAGADDTLAIDRLLAHIEALTARLGAERVGIGTDLQAGGKYVPEPLNRDDAFDEIRRRLVARGLDVASVDGILGGNVLRTLAGAHR